jgi:hypothetical protein
LIFSFFEFMASLFCVLSRGLCRSSGRFHYYSKLSTPSTSHIQTPSQDQKERNDVNVSTKHEEPEIIDGRRFLYSRYVKQKNKTPLLPPYRPIDPFTHQVDEVCPLVSFLFRFPILIFFILNVETI